MCQFKQYKTESNARLGSSSHSSKGLGGLKQRLMVATNEHFKRAWWCNSLKQRLMVATNELGQTVGYNTLRI